MSLPKLTPELLEDLYAQYNDRSFWKTDPIEFVHRYRNPLNQELVAILAAVLAYGNVPMIRRSMEDLLARLERATEGRLTEAYALASGDRSDVLREALSTFRHRFNRGDDVFHLIRALARLVREHRTLGEAFRAHYDPKDADVGPSLSRFVSTVRRLADQPPESSFHYFLTAPDDGSCCKRWCMLLRWMGRKDQVDPGLWSYFLRKDQLILPLDTHTGRITRHYRMTRLRTLNWKAAQQATRALQRFDAEDPVRFDFALSRLGIVEKKTLRLAKRKRRG